MEFLYPSKRWLQKSYSNSYTGKTFKACCVKSTKNGYYYCFYLKLYQKSDMLRRKREYRVEKRNKTAFICASLLTKDPAEVI